MQISLYLTKHAKLKLLSESFLFHVNVIGNDTLRDCAGLTEMASTTAGKILLKFVYS